MWGVSQARADRQPRLCQWSREGRGHQGSARHGAHFSTTPCREEEGEVLDPLQPSLTEPLLGDRLPGARACPPAGQPRSKAEPENIPEAENAGSRQLQGEAAREAGRIWPDTCPLPSALPRLGSPRPLQRPGYHGGSSLVNICCDAQPFSRKHRPPLPWMGASFPGFPKRGVLQPGPVMATLLKDTFY